MYDFRMRAMNEKGYGMYTNFKTFTTFAGKLCVFHYNICMSLSYIIICQDVTFIYLLY